MDRKLLFKCNIMGNSVMKQNRITKSNNDRNTKRKELFSRNRDICDDEPTQSSSISTTKKLSKKAEEIAKKEESYRARFAVYMEAKRQRLAQEKHAKKLPFLNAVGGHSKHVAPHTSFQFTAPKAPVRGKEKEKMVKHTKAMPVRNEQLTFTSKTKSQPASGPRTRSAVARQRIEEPVAKQKKTTRPANLKITKNSKSNLLSVGPSHVLEETPLMKDKVFTFNGIAATSTTLKNSIVKGIEKEDFYFDDTLSPIDRIAPLEITVNGENVAEEPHAKKADSPVKEGSFIEKCTSPAAKYETPPKQGGENEGTFYLSPFVTTSRGKCSAKRERQSRNSVYKLELNQSVEESVDFRRRREAVKYFRKILDDEISRLNSVCTTWELYKEGNAHSYEEHCSDMINVAVGQTKLLISGKFKQFEKLIDKCEKVANEKLGYRELMNCEDDVTAEDLQGFWNIVKLQADNVDLRFEKLTAWKNNDWKDPDEKPKTKKKVLAKSMKVKQTKQKVKPTDRIRSLLLKARQEFLKNNAQNNTVNQDIIFVTRNQPVSTPVKENRLSLCMRNQTPYRTSIGSKENRVPNTMTPAHRRLSILKNAGSGNRYKPRLSETPKSSTSSRRKSILKSVPKCMQKKSVLFSEQIDYKSPERSSSSSNNFCAPSATEVADESDDGLRVMHLRARAVLMRDDIFDY